MHRTGDGPLTRTIVKPILGRVLRHGFTDMRGMEEIVRRGFQLSRADLADGTLHCLTDRTSVHTAISIAT
jgi:hypothetical protein